MARKVLSDGRQKPDMTSVGSAGKVISQRQRQSKKSRFRTSRTCHHCEVSPAVENGLCEECSTEYYTWCDCCRSMVLRDDSCRHVFFTSDGFGGAGSNEISPATYKLSFFALLDRMAEVASWNWQGRKEATLVDAIETEIQADRFWTHTHQSLLGGEAEIDFICLRPDLKAGSLAFACVQSSAIFFKVPLPRRNGITSGSPGSPMSPRSPSPGDGWQWLQSLCAEETKTANQLTVRWIQAWKRNRSRDHKYNHRKRSAETSTARKRDN